MESRTSISAARSRYQWDQRLQHGAGAYRGRGGRIVSRAEVRGALEAAVDRSRMEARDLTERLRSGSITVVQWQRDMAQLVKDSHLAAVALERGGFDQMRPADYGRAGQIIRRQYTFLNAFAEGIASGRIPLDGRVLARAQMYVDAAVEAYHRSETASMRERGFDEVMNVLDPGAEHHCGGCLEQTWKGWQPIGEGVPIGQRDCTVNDRCWWLYRNSETGVVFDPEDADQR